MIKKRTKGGGKPTYWFRKRSGEYEEAKTFWQKLLFSWWSCLFPKRSIWASRESCATPIIPVGTLLCLDPKLLPNTNVCYKKWFCIWGYLSTWILGNRQFFKMSLSSSFKVPYLLGQKMLFNWSSVVFRSIMHGLMGTLVYTAHQNPMLVTRNDAELGSTEKHSGFQKTVCYCYMSRLCYFCPTSRSKAIMYKTSKESFYKLYIWYVIYYILSIFTDPNTFVWIIFTAYPLCSWHCSACLNRTYIGSGLADTEAPITKLIA